MASRVHKLPNDDAKQCMLFFLLFSCEQELMQTHVARKGVDKRSDTAAGPMAVAEQGGFLMVSMQPPGATIRRGILPDC